MTTLVIDCKDSMEMVTTLLHGHQNQLYGADLLHTLKYLRTVHSVHSFQENLEASM